MTSRPKVVVTRRLPDVVEARLSDAFDAVLNPTDVPLQPQALAAALASADGVLTTVTDRVDGAALASPRRAGIVANFAVGVNNIDLEAARAQGVVVTNTPGVLTDATADVALTLILNVTRRVAESAALLREGRWKGFAPTHLLGRSLQGRTLGIIGMGRIGQALARRCHFGLGMNVVYTNRSAVNDPGVPSQALDSIGAVMEASDVVSLHLPGGAENDKVISAEHIARMKPDGILINTARGDVVDEEALTEALKHGRVGGAGLDVFYNEPQVPPDLMDLPNVCLLPHIGSATVETRTAMGMLAVDNLVAHFGDRNYPSRVV
ncbi:MAG: D-glycerate dehydrogenase [Pseudomonadota bacterium]